MECDIRLAIPLQFLSFLMTSTSTNSLVRVITLVSMLQSLLKTQDVNLADDYQVMFFKEAESMES